MVIQRLFRLSVLFVLGQMPQGAVTQKCGSEVSVSGWMLRRHIYHTMVAEIGTCVSECQKDDRCQSFNFVISIRMCEFSNRTKEARPGDFIADPNRFYYRRASRVPLGSILELPAETCKEIKASEGQAVSDMYWLSNIKPGVAVLAYCNMDTEDVDECSSSYPVCDLNAICNNTLGSYHCTCNTGFSGDGKTCQDINECSASPAPCDVNATCQNTEGSYLCSCKSGFAGDGKTCQNDIDECSDGSHDCLPDLASCTNTVGSYKCSCKSGYEGNGNTSCVAIPECHNYKSLTGASRNVRYGFGWNGDKNIGPGWFRFAGSAGRRMATSCPRMYRCGTTHGGWMNGGHPSVLDGVVTRPVCFRWLFGCCYKRIEIKVRNCGSYHVYYLRGTSAWWRRYCGSY